ncbi:uncharacterized protein N7443_010209 [Penicillium atrosanguineum]|uniref:uncharacterized protein n=1 Tax=Penicillium atrosanguineum TaxID=1132637 RepID=UPI0023A6F03F|nr:uncharacterized protein N7443_010209 [Penicillium atrosanguineum]KAJ5289956.1 hypothetical protein N7443_010209 [Penicillium atrosanguineum]
MSSSVAYSETRALPDHGRSLNGSYRLGADRVNMDDGRPKNDDIFLNIARSDSGRRDSLGRSDFRRSRLGYSGQGLRSPISHVDKEETPSPDQRFSNVDNPLLSQNGSPTLPYSSNTHTSSASAHPLDDPNRFRYSSLTTGARSTIGAPRSRLSRTSPETSPRSPQINRERRASVQEPQPQARLHRRSTLSTVRSSREPSASETTERVLADAERARVDGTESTLSTTAPSTVWDELDDLKSRIRKLELTGKLPPSSQAAISGANQERPRTAATTASAISTSPRHYRKASTPSADADNAVQNPVHPLLQSALAKAKSVLTSEVYMALEATITDALNLSTMLGVSTAPSGSVSVLNGGYSSSERHARRKADSVCRGLTELCLALTDEQLKRNRPQSSHAGGVQPPRSNGENGSITPTHSYQRASSYEPEAVERPERRQSISSRLPSRLDARRASLVSHSPGTPATDTKPTPSSPGGPPSSRLHRISASLRSRRPPTDEENGEPAVPLNRSFSRTMTDIGTPSPGQTVSPQQRFSRAHSGLRIKSRDWASPRAQHISNNRRLHLRHLHHCLEHLPLCPKLGFHSAAAMRPPSVYSPATSRSNIQAGSRRYGLSPATPASGAEDSPRPPQLEPSQTRISVPSSKTVTSYTPIQQPRLRTNSLGARKFGLRRRSAVMTDDNTNMDDSID